MNNLQYTQQLIEESIFERKKETIYKCDFADNLLNQYDTLFQNILGSEINRIIDLQSKYSKSMKYVIKSDIVKTFVEKLYMLSCPNILKGNLLAQQFFLLYIISILFYRYNDQYLKLPINEFINRIYYINIVSICSKHLIQSRKTTFKIIKQVYNEIKEKVTNTIDNTYTDFYKNNESIIKNDIIQLFLSNIVSKFNPLEIENLEDFYKVLIRRVFFFYLKSKSSIDPELISDLINQQSNSLSALEPQSERFKIYEEAIYLAQIQQICNNSEKFNIIVNEFDKLKNILLPNEIQILLLNQDNIKSKNILVNYKLNLQSLLSANKYNIDYIKNKLPQVYKLLRSIHISSTNNTFTNINKQYMKDQFFISLCDNFKDKLDLNIISPILKNISDNLVDNLTIGEFIDMVTLVQIDINGLTFIEQFKEFLNLVLNSIIKKD